MYICKYNALASGKLELDICVVLNKFDMCQDLCQFCVLALICPSS